MAGFLNNLTFVLVVMCCLERNGANEAVSVSLCGLEHEVELTPSGRTSSVVFTFEPGGLKNRCKIKLVAPTARKISIQLYHIEPSRKHGTSLKSNQNYYGRHQKGANITSNGCPVTMRLTNSERYTAWRFDPCLDDVNLLHGSFRPSLPPQLTITWIPTTTPIKIKMVATVMEEGDACKSPDKHSCLHIGHVPVYCISNDLLCDGVPNCPMVVSTHKDEGKEACKKKKDQEALEMLRSYLDEENKEALESLLTRSSSTTTTRSSIALDTKNIISNTTEIIIETDSTQLSGLSQYGPWGFLLVGILICGALLVVCGLWECYCRKPKPDSDVPSISEVPDFINDNTSSIPALPSYDELDQPPSYSTLFPTNKLTSVEEALTEQTPDEVIIV